MKATGEVMSDRPHDGRKPPEGDAFAGDWRRPPLSWKSSTDIDRTTELHGLHQGRHRANRLYRDRPADARRRRIIVHDLRRARRSTCSSSNKVKNIVDIEEERCRGHSGATIEVLRRGQAHGLLPTLYIAQPVGADGGRRSLRCASRHGIFPVYKMIDTCASEFSALRAVLLLDLRRRERIAW